MTKQIVSAAKNRGIVVHEPHHRQQAGPHELPRPWLI
jgi:hypothetical protein